MGWKMWSRCVVFQMFGTPESQICIEIHLRLHFDLMSCDGDTALLCDGLCYKTVHKWTILVRD